MNHTNSQSQSRYSQITLSTKKGTSFLTFLLFFLLTSCTTFNGTRFEDTLGTNTDLIKFSYTIAENLIYNAVPPIIPRHPDMPVLVTTYVDNNNLENSSRFGRILQEHISSRLVQLGYTVREIKIAQTLSIQPRHGETILSRDLSRLGETQQAQAILVGTISRTNRTMYISSRLVNPVNNNIISTDDIQLFMDDNVLAMFGLKRRSNIDSPVEKPDQPFLNSIL